MKLKIIVLFFICSLFCSQNTNIRFAYEYKYAPDSTNIDSTFTELMYLDVLKEGSRFYSRDVFVGDSLMSNAMRGLKGNGSVKLDNTKGKKRDVIKKMYPNFNIITTTNVGLDQYIYEDNRKINWEISKDQKFIDGFKVQKASAKAFGRNWTAWFTTEYPFQDGPYKFYGLPGIIVKIEDENKGHVFDLKVVKILRPEETWPLETQKNKKKNTINTTREKYKEVFSTYRKDPMKDWRARMGGAVRLQATYNGNPMDLKDMEKITKNRLKKENNILEIDLFDEGLK